MNNYFNLFTKGTAPNRPEQDDTKMTIREQLQKDVLKPLGALIQEAWQNAKLEQQKKQEEARVRAALNLKPYIGYGLLDFLGRFPLPTDCAVDLEIFPGIVYLGNNDFRVRFFLKEPHVIQSITLKRHAPAVFDQNLGITKAQSFQIFGDSLENVYPGLARIQCMVRAEQLDLTTVDLLLKVRL